MAHDDDRHEPHGSPKPGDEQARQLRKAAEEQALAIRLKTRERQG